MREIFTKWQSSLDRFVKCGWQTGTNLVLSIHVELILLAFHQFGHLEGTGGAVYSLNFDKALLGHITLLHIVASERRASIKLGLIPGQHNIVLVYLLHMEVAR